MSLTISQAHHELTGFLADLAILIGATESYGVTLPDGARPDVILVDGARRFLFFGEAKASELPSNSSARTRMFNYLDLLVTFCGTGARAGLLAVGCWREEQAWLWAYALDVRGCSGTRVGRPMTFAPGIHVAWVSVGLAGVFRPI
jgi:hypothetical protein